MKVHQVESYRIKRVMDSQSTWLMFESRIGRLIQRKSPLGGAGGVFLGSLSDHNLLKNDYMGKFKGRIRFARNI